MADNNTGLRFNPSLTISSGWYDPYKAGTNQVVNNYLTAPSSMPNDTIPIWQREQMTTPAATPNYEKEALSAKRDLDNWDKGLYGLSLEAQKAWADRNRDLIENESESAINQIWRNQKFFEIPGATEEIFQSLSDDEVNKAVEDWYANKYIANHYAGNGNLNQLLGLTTEGKKELINSGYLSDDALNKINKEEGSRDWFDYSLGERLNAVTSMATMGGGTGMALGTTYGAMGGTAVVPGLGTVSGGIGGGVLGTLLGAAGGAITGLILPGSNAANNITNRKAENEDILNKIIVSDNERKKAESKEDIDNARAYYNQLYANGELSAEEINKRWDDLALNGKRTVMDEFGNAKEVDYTGSNYYSAFKDTDEFEKFGISDKIAALAQADVLSYKYGQGTALQILDQDMANIVNTNQSGWEWAGNTAKNLWVGGIANLGQKTTALGALAAKNYYGLQGAMSGDVADFIDNYEKYGNAALANYLEGKDASGDGSDNSIIFNPTYWDKVDKYNTLGIDEKDTFLGMPIGKLIGDKEDEMDRADANGGISKNTNVYKPGTENDFWSWSTLNNAVAMNKFAWSDLLTNMGLAGIVKRATALAGGIETAPGVLATESTAASQFINKAGSFGVLNASSLGIDMAYGMQTYHDVLEKNNAKIDQIIAQDVDKEVARRLASEEGRKEFQTYVDQENAKRQSRAGESGKWIPVDEERAWQEYTEFMKERVLAEQEKLHEEDRQEARNAAADAFATDATIEHVRMASTAGLFKSYLFDKGTLNALKMNNPYVNTTVRNGAYALAQNATKKKAAGIFAQSVWGGFHSNYFDDVTVGFAEGFGLQEYNNYLLQKYNPAAYGSVVDEYVNPIVAGMNGALNAMGEKRSFLDGAVGALGTVVTFSPNVHGMRSHSDIMKQAKEQAEKDAKDGHKVSDYSKIEKISHFVNNPLMQAIADAKSATRMTEREINRVNDIIKDSGYALDNTVEAVTALNNKAFTREGTSLIEAEDAKDKEAFTLASQLLSLRNSGVVVNAQTEPEKAKWLSKKKASQIISRGLDRMLGLNMFEAESPYTLAMQSLQDAATIDEEASSEEEAARKQDLIDTFLKLDANKNAVSDMSEEEKIDFATERLKKNATGLLTMMDRMEKIQKKFENSSGASMHPEIAKQLMYQYTLDKRWKDRLHDIEGRITNDDSEVDDIDVWYNKKIKEYQDSNSAIAKYGSRKGFDKAYNAQEKTVERAEKAYNKAQQEAAKDNDPTKSIKENAFLKARRMLQEKRAKETLEKEKSRLEEMEEEGKQFTESTAVEGNNVSFTSDQIISAEEILRLKPADRLRMLDDFYRSDYSSTQQAEIDRAKNMLMQDGRTINAVMEDLRDAVILSNRIEDNMETATRIMKNPMEASLMQQALVDNRKRNVIRYFNDKIVAEAFQELVKDPASTVNADAVADKVRGMSTAVLNGMQRELSEVMKTSTIPDITLDIIKDGINKVIDERNNRTKDTLELDKFISKTKKVSHTDTIEVPTTIDLGDGNVATTVTSYEETNDVELSDNDRKLLEYALDYAVERGISTEELADKVTTEDFDKYIDERNHAYQLTMSKLGTPVETNVATVENQVNKVSPEYMKSLVGDVVDAYNENKSEVETATAEKPTTKPISVATPPVEVKEEEGPRNEGYTPKAEQTADDPFGLGKPAAPAAPKTEAPAVEPPADAEGTGNNAPTPTNRNAEIIESAQLLNEKNAGDLGILLNEIDKMTVGNDTKDAIKDIIQTLVKNKSYDSIKAIQNAILPEALLNESAAPKMSVTASAIAGIDVESVKEKKNTNNNKAENTSNAGTDNVFAETTQLPSHLTTVDLDVMMGFEPFATYIQGHGIVGFLERLANYFKTNHEKQRAGQITSANSDQVVFLYDSALAAQVQESMNNKEGATYRPELDSPIVLALEIREGKNDHLVEDKSQLVKPTNIPDVRQGEAKILGYMPIGFMPASTNTRENATASAMTAIREAVKYDRNGTQIVSYAPQKGKKNGGPIKTSLVSIDTHTEEENIPHSGEEIPAKGVQLLMEENLNSETGSLVNATQEEKDAYDRATASGDREAVRKTPLYKKLRKAFIDRLSKKKVEAESEEEKDRAFMVFKLLKGTHDAFNKPVRVKKISETVDRNTGEPIVKILNEIDATGSRAKDLIDSNSRFSKLFKKLAKVTINKEALRSGVIDSEGYIINQAEYNRILNDYADSIKSAIDNNFNVDNLHVKAAIETENGEKTIKVNIYSGEVNDNNMLATLTTKYDGNISEAEFAMMMKDLILDAEGNTRKGLNNENYERVKWQVNYEDANNANDATNENKENARKNLEDLYDDGVLEMQVTKLAYPARSVTVSLNNKMRSDLYAPKKEAPIAERPAGTVEAAEGQIDGDTGAVMVPTRDSVIRAIPVNIWSAVQKLISDSKTRNLTEDGNHYNILGQLWSRVTSIKYTLPGLHGRFNSENGWGLPSSKIGDSLDAFGRDVFNGIFDNMSEAERAEAFKNYDNSTEKNYAEVYQKLQEFKTRLLNKNQVVIGTLDKDTNDPGKITTKGVLNVTVKNGDNVEIKQVRVAGTLDVLAIDKDGNLHVYDFKTSRSHLTETTAKEKGYDRQLSMYAKFLEEELAPYGIKVESINLIPVDVTYPTPSGIDNEGKAIQGAQKTYSTSRVGSNQLLTKNIGAEDSTYEEYHGANFQVQTEFPLTRLEGEALTASFDKMTAEEKQAIVEAIKEQDETAAPSEETIQPEVLGVKPEVAEEAEEESPAENGLGSLGAFLAGLKPNQSEESSEDSAVDTTPEGTANAIDGENSLLARLRELQEACKRGK